MKLNLGSFVELWVKEKKNILKRNCLSYYTEIVSKGKVEMKYGKGWEEESMEVRESRLGVGYFNYKSQKFYSLLKSV